MRARPSHWFGTDASAAMFSRAPWAISPEVGITVVLALHNGIAIGDSGFYGGIVDRFLSGYVFTFFAFPGCFSPSR
jgi:ABC-type dipeptide/oligopeptide/nickel transport system permease subunit